MVEPKRTQPRRRADDPRVDQLSGRLEDVRQQVSKIDEEVEEIRDKVSQVHELLITEPEASPLGRSLLGRSIVNAQRIEAVENRLRPLEDWRTEWRGVWRFLIGLGVVLSMVATLLTLGQRFGGW